LRVNNFFWNTWSTVVWVAASGLGALLAPLVDVAEHGHRGERPFVADLLALFYERVELDLKPGAMGCQECIALRAFLAFDLQTTVPDALHVNLCLGLARSLVRLHHGPNWTGGEVR
jgi:hypothetical protein